MSYYSLLFVTTMDMPFSKQGADSLPGTAAAPCLAVPAGATADESSAQSASAKAIKKAI
jgi:hypothetical protein